MTALAYVLLIVAALNVLVFLFGWIRGRKRHIDALCTASYVRGAIAGEEHAKAQMPFAEEMYHLAQYVQRQEKAAPWQ